MCVCRRNGARLRCVSGLSSFTPIPSPPRPSTCSPPPCVQPTSVQVVVNLYPFRSTVTASPPPSFEVGVENIDIGGPSMIRAGAQQRWQRTSTCPARGGSLTQACRHCAILLQQEPPPPTLPPPRAAQLPKT